MWGHFGAKTLHFSSKMHIFQQKEYSNPLIQLHLRLNPLKCSGRVIHIDWVEVTVRSSLIRDHRKEPFLLKIKEAISKKYETILFPHPSLSYIFQIQNPSFLRSFEAGSSLLNMCERRT